jgi:hypothetical protein
MCLFVVGPVRVVVIVVVAVVMSVPLPVGTV